MNILFIQLAAFMFLSALIFFGIRTFAGVGVPAFSRYEETLDNQLRSAYVFHDARRVVVFSLLGALFGGLILALLFRSWLVLPAAIMLVFLLPKVWLKRLRAGRIRRITSELPEVLLQLSGSMRAGSTLPSAIELLTSQRKGPLSEELEIVLREQRIGIRLEEALNNLADRVETEEMDLLVTAVQISIEVGGNLAETLERLSDTLRRKIEMEGKIKALTSQGILQGRVVTALPYFLLVVLMNTENAAMSYMLHGLLGWIWLALLLLMQFLGFRMIRKIVSIEI